MIKFQTMPVQKSLVSPTLTAEKGWLQAFSTMNQIFDGDWGGGSKTFNNQSFKLMVNPQFIKVFAEIPSGITINSFDLEYSNANGILYLVNDAEIRPLKISNGVCLTSFTTSQTSFIDGILGRF